MTERQQMLLALRLSAVAGMIHRAPILPSRTTLSSCPKAVAYRASLRSDIGECSPASKGKQHRPR
eukprot:5698874-Prymnesium_polylepis.1